VAKVRDQGIGAEQSVYIALAVTLAGAKEVLSRPHVGVQRCDPLSFRRQLHLAGCFPEG
jgi:hypothetical protein